MASVDRKLAAAMAELSRMQRRDSFDPTIPGSTPTNAQKEYLSDIGKYKFRVIRGGNRCLAEGTLVATPSGPRPIESLRVGDTVYDERGNVEKIVETHVQGIQQCVSIWVQDKEVTCSLNHKWLVIHTENEVPHKVETRDLDWENHRLLVTVDTKLVPVEFQINSPSLQECYDITVDGVMHVFQLDGGLVTSNSGKGATPAREISWILNDEHPYWQRPDSWRQEPLLFIIAGQDRKNMEIEIWGGKLRPQLNASDWREVRSGQVLQYCENRKTGDRIIFLTHADSSEKNRKHMQGYTAHYVWLDEMPASAALLDEIRLRASKPDAMFVMTFTPKFRSEEIRKAVDAMKPPYAKLYRFRRMDNPLYEGREAEVMAELEGYSDAYKISVLEGEWFVGESAVYEWTHDRMVEEPGDDYAPNWRHAISVDPALKSKFGFTMWAERPRDGKWFLVKGEYIEGIYAPDDMVEEVKKKIAGFNLIRRISDPESAWFIGQASKAQLSFISPNKQGRKAEMIKGLQAALSTGKIAIAPWCSDFVAEITSCQWANDSDKIVNSSSYHLLDCAQYFVDMKPAYDANAVPQTWEQALRTANTKRKKMEAAKATVAKWGQVKTIREWKPRGSYRLWK